MEALPRTSARALDVIVILTLIAEARVQMGLDGDPSVTLAVMLGAISELQRLAPLIRFADTRAEDDGAARDLADLHGEVARLAPLMARLARPMA